MINEYLKEKVFVLVFFAVTLVFLFIVLFNNKSLLDFIYLVVVFYYFVRFLFINKKLY